MSDKKGHISIRQQAIIKEILKTVAQAQAYLKKVPDTTNLSRGLYQIRNNFTIVQNGVFTNPHRFQTHRNLTVSASILSRLIDISASRKQHLDASATTNAAVKPEADDPYTTDTIPASNYRINTYRKEAVDLSRATLQKVYQDDLSKGIIDSLSRRFNLFEYDLNGDAGKEIFIKLTGPYFCGSGGCTILLLNPTGEILTTFMVTDVPIIINNTATNGWKDLILTSNDKCHLVKYTGKSNPGNPSTQPIYNMQPGDELPKALNVGNEAYPSFYF